MAKKSEIPVEAMYILAFLILMSLAGTSMYYYMEGQSTARNYRMSAAKILEESESLKLMIDQERQFVLETVIFFLGSQGGVSNVAEYNEYNISRVSAQDMECIEKMKEMNNGVYPSAEILSKCIKTPSAYNNIESLGVWKCDDKIYSYEECDEYLQEGNTIIPNMCCRYENKVCHEGCLLALGFNTDYCRKKAYCGALSCKENNLEIPETYQGVQYYYKIGDDSKGYFCESIIGFNPEINFPKTELWIGADSAQIIQSLLELSNTYFYIPHPSFNNYIKKIYNLDIKLSFQLKFKGCNNELCEFAWVPYSDYKQEFVARGIGGIPMISMSNELVSLQSIEIPMLDMVEYSKGMIEQKELANYFAKSLENQTLIESRVSFSQMPLPFNWKEKFSETMNINPNNDQEIINNYEIYDSSNCGPKPYSTTNYECLMQHASSKLYNMLSDPIIIERNEGYDYSLRPLFNFVKTSLGASIQNINLCGNDECEYGETFSNCPIDCTDNLCGQGSSACLTDDADYELNIPIILDSGKYAIFIKGKGNTSATINIKGQDYSFSAVSDGQYYQQLKFHDDTVGRCAYNKYVPEQTLEYYEGFGCCPKINYSNGQCKSEVLENTYCSKINNRYGRSQSGSYCFLNNDFLGNINYDINLISYSSSSAELLAIKDLKGLIEAIEIVRVDFDTTFNMVQRTINGITMNFGGSYEYYETTSDCVSPMIPQAIRYNDFSNEELWYSMLCLRSIGKTWTSIIENNTGLFDAFNSRQELGENQKIKIDYIIKNYDIKIEEFDEYYKVFYNQTGCPEGGCVLQLKENPQLLWVGSLNKTMNVLAGDELIIERLREIQRNSSYLSLPVKWIFAYRDKVRFNQSNPEINDNSECDLNYDFSKKAAPDCGCISNCEKQKMCLFNFTAIDVNNLKNELYEFEKIFVENPDYRAKGVVGR